ncbi:MAG: alpha/beta hydrolase [Bacilli bacterium]|jgi:pimeloyl-ACP methyl ester carboxylesterase
MEDNLTKNLQVIKETDPEITFKKPSKKTALLCTNGFQNSDTHDSAQMLEYFNANFGKDYPECEIVPVHLYAPSDPKTHHSHLFEKNLENTIKKYIAEGYDIILMGYSFSGALCCKMQHKYKKAIRRMILVAPVYDTILNNMIPNYIGYAWKFHKLNKKYGARVAKTMGRNTTKGMVSLLLSIFSSLLSNRKYFRLVSCDTLIIWGTDDKLCTIHSMSKVNKKIHSHHILYKYPHMTHGILKTIKDNGIVFEDILHYSFDTPFILEKNTQNVVKKQEVKSTVKYDSDGEVIPSFNEIFTDIDPDGDKETSREQEGL